jgi:acyl phosphate:glycerol-3-phosphate acyltransferase
VPDTPILIAVASLGYLLGSVPMGVLLSRLFGWDDPRTHGSGHTGAMNVSRRGGKVALVVVLIADTLKGLAAVSIASLISANPWAVPLAGIAAVAGHCWPVWLHFRGGMGLATGMGAVVIYAWVAVLFAGVGLAIIRFLIVKHTPRAVIVAALLVVPAAWLMRLSPPIFVLTAGIAMLIAARHTVDWGRKYD